MKAAWFQVTAKADDNPWVAEVEVAERPSPRRKPRTRGRRRPVADPGLVQIQATAVTASGWLGSSWRSQGAPGVVLGRRRKSSRSNRSRWSNWLRRRQK